MLAAWRDELRRTIMRLTAEECDFGDMPGMGGVPHGNIAAVGSRSMPCVEKEFEGLSGVVLVIDETVAVAVAVMVVVTGVVTVEERRLLIYLVIAAVGLVGTTPRANLFAKMSVG